MLTIFIAFVVGVLFLGATWWLFKRIRAKFRLFVVAVIVLIFFIASSYSSRSHPVYKNTLLAINNNSKIAELIGLPIKSGFSMQSNWSDTHMRMEFPIKGSKGNGTVTVYAEMNNGNWNFEELKVKINSSIYDIKK